MSREKTQQTEHWAGITDDHKRVAFARFLASKGKARDAIVQFQSSRIVSFQARRELISELISAHAFREAFEIWRGMDRADDRRTAIHDGGFEASNTFDDSGFGWRFAQGSQGVRMALDSNQPHTGKQTLLVIFSGTERTRFLSQLRLVARTNLTR